MAARRRAAHGGSGGRNKNTTLRAHALCRFCRHTQRTHARRRARTPYARRAQHLHAHARAAAAQQRHARAHCCLPHTRAHATCLTATSPLPLTLPLVYGQGCGCLCLPAFFTTCLPFPYLDFCICAIQVVGAFPQLFWRQGRWRGVAGSRPQLEQGGRAGWNRCRQPGFPRMGGMGRQERSIMGDSFYSLTFPHSSLLSLTPLTSHPLPLPSLSKREVRSGYR